MFFRGFNILYSNRGSLSRRRLEAYVSARDYLRKELLDSKEKAQWLDGNTSMVDVASLVESKKAEYETSSEKRRVIRKHFDMMSSRIMHYGQVMDMLSQHHPEYVALAWGTAKFVLMVGITFTPDGDRTVH